MTKMTHARIGELIEADRKAGKLARPPGRPAKNRVRKRPDLPTLADRGVDKDVVNAFPDSHAIKNLNDRNGLKKCCHDLTGHDDLTPATMLP
jgi:hypothetical protein